MRGMEKRDALNDNQPGFGLSVAETLVAASGLSILLGEDDPINAMLVRVVLEKGGHKVRHVEDFETLLDCALCEAMPGPILSSAISRCLAATVSTCWDACVATSGGSISRRCR